jgi:drug/metabolite transporter (DMT)-like permease
MRYWAVVLALGAALIWGAANTMNKLALTYCSPTQTLIIQLGASVAFLLIVCILFKVGLGQLIKALPLWWTGLLEPGLTYLFGVTGLETSNASVASVILSLEAAFVVVIVTILGFEKASLKFWMLSALSLVGALLVVLGQDTHPGQDGSLRGAMLIFAATLCASLYAVFSARFLGSKNPVAVVTVQQGTALCFIAGYAVLANSKAQLICWPEHELSLIAASGVLQFAIAFLMFITSIKILGAAAGSVYLNAVPIIGLAFGYLFLQENLTQLQWAGGLIAISALYFIGTSAQPHEEETA